MKVLAPAEAYGLWASTYDSTPSPLLALEERLLAPAIAKLAGGTVVDVGCGTGRWGRHPALARSRYIGVDASLPMLRQGAPGVLSVAHAGCLPLPQGISDLTLCTFSLAYLACPFECLSEMARITRKGGAVLVSDLHPASGWERTFRRVGETYAIVHNCHAIAVVKDAARRAGLSLDAEYLASFGEPELPFFRKAGREDLYAKAAAVPAIWAGVWTAP